MAAAEHPEATSARIAPFAEILCAVDGSRGSAEAARQGIALAKPDGAIRFVAVSQTRGKGLAAVAQLSEVRAQEALDEAVSAARKAGVSATSVLFKDGSPADVLLTESQRCDLLTLGSHGGSRAGGIMLGSIASQAAHRTEGPLLVARPTTDGDFPRRILVATDGSPGSWAALWMTVRIVRTRDSEAAVVHVPSGLHPERARQIDRQIAAIEEATNVEPQRIGEPGRTAERIVAAAATTDSSLIVIGRRGLTGIRALGSVSERVAHRAPCSTLLVPASEA
jgi:nucleotide-binding universal stress UspA family protein